MKIRPEAERRLRAGFQRRVDEQRQRYAVQLTHGGQLAVRFECGEVAGVFSRQAGIGRRALVPGLLPLAAVPFLIAEASSRCLSGRMASMDEEVCAGLLERAGRASGHYARDAIRSRLVW